MTNPAMGDLDPTQRALYDEYNEHNDAIREHIKRMGMTSIYLATDGKRFTAESYQPVVEDIPASQIEVTSVEPVAPVPERAAKPAPRPPVAPKPPETPEVTPRKAEHEPANDSSRSALRKFLELAKPPEVYEDEIEQFAAKMTELLTMSRARSTKPGRHEGPDYEKIFELYLMGKSPELIIRDTTTSVNTIDSNIRTAANKIKREVDNPNTLREMFPNQAAIQDALPNLDMVEKPKQPAVDQEAKAATSKLAERLSLSSDCHMLARAYFLGDVSEMTTRAMYGIKLTSGTENEFRHVVLGFLRVQLANNEALSANRPRIKLLPEEAETLDLLLGNPRLRQQGQSYQKLVKRIDSEEGLLVDGHRIGLKRLKAIITHALPKLVS